MSEEKILTQHDVNKRILAKEEIVHGGEEIRNVSGRWWEDDYRIYCHKRKQFYDAVKQYKDINKTALWTNVCKSDESADAQIKFGFLRSSSNIESDCLIEPYVPDCLIRKKTLRPAFGELEKPIEIRRSFEPWTRRYIILNRFIRAGRKLIVKNRLLKRLAALKALSKDEIDMHEATVCLVINESYNELFLKFI